jgi:hypothetical protein
MQTTSQNYPRYKNYTSIIDITFPAMECDAVLFVKAISKNDRVMIWFTKTQEKFYHTFINISNLLRILFDIILPFSTLLDN